MKLYIKELCKQKKITLRQLATDLNLGYQNLSNYSSGHREPDLQTLINIADYLDVSIDTLLCRGNKKITMSSEDMKEITRLQKKISEIMNKYQI